MIFLLAINNKQLSAHNVFMTKPLFYRFFCFVLTVVSVLSSTFLLLGIAGKTEFSDDISYLSSYKDLPEKRKTIKTVWAKIGDNADACKVTLSGIPYSRDSAFYRDIKIVFDTQKETVYSPPVDYGYGADIESFNFTSDNRQQIFYSASSGGSGGFGYYYVLDIKDGKVTIKFDYAEFVNEYTATYADNYVAKIYKSGREVVDFKIAVDQTSQKFWNAEEKYIGNDCPLVSDLNYVEPTYNYLDKRYRLNLWQKVTLFCQADVAGYIITVKDLDESKPYSRDTFKGIYIA